MSCTWNQGGLTQQCLRTLSREASPHTGLHTWHIMTSPEASPSRNCAVALLETGWRGESENKAEKTLETSNEAWALGFASSGAHPWCLLLKLHKGREAQRHPCFTLLCLKESENLFSCHASKQSPAQDTLKASLCRKGHKCNERAAE